MAGDTLEVRAWYGGTWRDDDVTDNIIRQIAVQTQAEKGKKVKLRVSPEGVKVTKSTFFQGTIMNDFIPLNNIYFMTVNQHHPSCLLAIIKDVTRKYMILAFRCKTPVDAGNVVHYYKSYKERFSGKGDNFELKRKDNGNWTLKSRSATNAHRHLLEVYSKPNGDVKTTPIFLPQDDVIERDDNHVHGRDQHNIAIQTAKAGPDVDAMSEASDVTLRDELETLSHELREIKYMLEKSTGISAEEHLKQHRQTSQPNSARERNNNVGYVQKGGTASVYSTYPRQNGQPDGVARVTVPDYRSFGVQTAPKSKKKHTSSQYPGFVRVNGPAEDEDGVNTQTTVVRSNPPVTSTVVTSEPVKTSYVVTPRPENGKAEGTSQTITRTTTEVKKTSPPTARRQDNDDVPEYAVVRRYVVPPGDGPQRLVATRSSTSRPPSEAPSSPRPYNPPTPQQQGDFVPGQVRTTYHKVMEPQPGHLVVASREPGYFVKFDPKLMPREKRPRMRKVPMGSYRVPSTVVRPIEDTYPRGGTLRRVLVPADLAPRRMSRPHSVHGLHLTEDDDLRMYDPSLDERRVPAAPGTFVYHHELF